VQTVDRQAADEHPERDCRRFTRSAGTFAMGRRSTSRIESVVRITSSISGHVRSSRSRRSRRARRASGSKLFATVLITMQSGVSKEDIWEPNW
jgi:hypothetical protein